MGRVGWAKNPAKLPLKKHTKCIAVDKRIKLNICKKDCKKIV